MRPFHEPVTGAGAGVARVAGEGGSVAGGVAKKRRGKIRRVGAWAAERGEVEDWREREGGKGSAAAREWLEKGLPGTEHTLQKRALVLVYVRMDSLALVCGCGYGCGHREGGDMRRRGF